MLQDSEIENGLLAEPELTTEQRILKDFIFNLEALPELWDSSNEDYSVKRKRAEAYQKLLHVYKKIKPAATVDDVRKKINSLKSNYRKELKRIVESKRSASYNVYTPKSWTFHALQFLNKNEKHVNVVVVSEYDSDPIEFNTSQSLEELDDSSFSSVNHLLYPNKKAMSQDSEIERGLLAEPELTTEKQILHDFVFNLEALPELWDSSNKDYFDKIKRAAAYQKLLHVYKKIKPAATFEDVRKKINSLRSNYRKDLKRIVESKRSGTDNVYTPKSWTFQALQFLNKNEKPANVVMLSKYDSDPIEINTRRQSLEELDDSSFSSVNPLLHPKKKAKVGSMAKQIDLIEKACLLLSEKPEPPASDINASAKYWSEKLEKLQPKQRIFAEKAINDILFEAEMGTLNRNSVQINQVVTPPIKVEDFVPLSSEDNIFASTPTSPEYDYSRTQSPDAIYESEGET